jgi:hypothetical protein
LLEALLQKAENSVEGDEEGPEQKPARIVEGVVALVCDNLVRDPKGPRAALKQLQAGNDENSC